MVATGKTAKVAMTLDGVMPACQSRREAQAVLRIENWLHVQRAYGESIAQAACEELCRQLNQLLQDSAAAVPAASGMLHLHVGSHGAFGRNPTAEMINLRLIEICRTIPTWALLTRAGPVHLWVSGHWRMLEDLPMVGEHPSTEPKRIAMDFHGEPPGHGEAWAAAYRAAMLKVARTFSVLSLTQAEPKGTQACLFWQPIHDCNASGVTFYHEALLRFIDRRGAARAPAEELAALERLGFIGLLDRHLVLQVIRELEASPEAALGVNISALSLCSPALWGAVERHLRIRPKVASRLSFEITETAAIPDMTTARQWVDRLRRFGCQIVLDDFGMGHASFRQAMALSPNVIKIDKFFLRQGLSAFNGRAMLEHLIGLAQSLKAAVVMEGVETAEQATLASALGATLQQGWFWGQPSASRLWRLVVPQGKSVRFPGATTIASEAMAEIIDGIVP